MRTRHLAALVVISMGLLSPLLWGQPCSTNTIKGSYGFTSSIRVQPPRAGAGSGRIRVIGVINYDGSGNASTTGLSISPSGQEKVVNLTGAYEIDSHCVGRVTLNSDSSGSQAVWRFVVVNGGTELLTLSERSPDTTPFVQQKQ